MDHQSLINTVLDIEEEADRRKLGIKPNYHYVKFIISDGDSPRAKFKCTAPEMGECRTLCQTCIIEESKEQCGCEYYMDPDGDEESEEGREPNITGGHPCNYLNWLYDAPDETYNGPTRGVSGPDWAPIGLQWEGDYFTWHYLEDKGLTVGPNGRNMLHHTGENHTVSTCADCQRTKKAILKYGVDGDGGIPGMYKDEVK